MSNSNLTYNFHDSNIRVVQNDKGEVLFCLADVCASLNLTNATVIANQVKDEFGIPKLNLGVVTRPDGSRIEANFITEPQLYFVMMRSRAKVAREFRQWICNEVLPSIRKTGSYTLSQKDKALKELSDRVKELADEKREQESSLNLTITCLKDELRKTEAARAFEQKWRAKEDKETGARFLQQEREHEQKIKVLECKYGQKITDLKLEIEQLHFQYDKDTATPAQLYEVTKIVHKRAQELGCATALVWRRIHESCKVPSYKQLAAWQADIIIDSKLSGITLKKVQVRDKKTGLPTLTPQLRDTLNELAAMSTDEKFLYDLMDTRELLIAIADTATDSERIKSLPDTITRLQQFFDAHGHDCVELANLKEPKVLPFDPQGYLS
jgi:prophage antirepressor-like protein